MISSNLSKVIPVQEGIQIVNKAQSTLINSRSLLRRDDAIFSYCHFCKCGATRNPLYG